MRFPGTASSRWLWLIAISIILAEFLLFDRMTSRHHAAVYPRWSDQIQYLSEAYKAYQQMQAHGLGAALKFTLTKTALQGTLHDFFAVLVFRLAGSASRSAALSLNMLVFVAWQAAWFAVVRRRTGSWTLAWMGFGLLPCIAWPWSGQAGSAVDFRLDHAAMCLMGITTALALLTDGFRARRWAVAVGVATGVTLLERFLTGVYLAAIFGATAMWIVGGEARMKRLGNLALAGLIAAAMAAPVFWFNRAAIYNYYWVGHISGAESAARLRGFDLWQSGRFVLGHLADMHLGKYFGWTVAGLTGLVLALAAVFRRKAAIPPAWDWLFFGGAFVLLPAAVLTVHPQKSEFVLGVMVPGVVLLVLWLWHQLWARVDWPAGRPWQRVLPLLPAVAALAAGGAYFVDRQVAMPHRPDFLAGAAQVNRIADRIFSDSRALGLTHPYIGVDQVVDFIDAPILQVVCYERQKVWVPFVIQLPDSILADKDEVMIYRWKLCDFVLLTDEMPGEGYWPYDKQMRRLYPELKAWCQGHMKFVETYSLFGRRMSLYQRTEPR